MPDETTIPQEATTTATPETTTPQAEAPLTGGIVPKPQQGNAIPNTYGDYLTQTAAKKTPKFVLPLAKRYELLKPSEKFVYDAANGIARQFAKVSQPEFLTNANNIADIDANKIMQLTSLDAGTIETDEQKINLDQPKQAELDKQALEEAGTTIKDWGEVLGKQVLNGTIIKVDNYFRKADRAFMRSLKELNPTWTGEFVQMQSDKDGKIVPKAYNMAAAFRKDPTAFSQNLPGIEVMASTKKISDADATAFIDEQIKLPPDFTKMTPVELDKYYSKSEEGFQAGDKVGMILKTNLPLAKVLMNEPKLLENFRNEVANMEGAQVGQEYAQYRAFNKAIEKTFGDKEVDPKAFEIYGAAQGFKQLEYNFTQAQNELSSKMKVAGENAIRNNGMQDKILAYQALQVKMLTNPKSITPDDQKQFASMTLQLNDAISKSGINELQNDWYKFNQNNQSYAKIIKGMPAILDGAKDPKVKEGLDILAEQQRGQMIAGMAGKLFPQAEKFEMKEHGLVGKGSANIFKSAYREIVSSTQNDILALASLWGGDKASYAMAGKLSHGGDIEHALGFQTPAKPTNTDNEGMNMLNEITNFSTEATGGIGSMLPAIALGAAGGEVLELSHFALPTYYETMTSLRNAGIPEDKARMVGVTNMLLMAGSMKLAFMPSHILASQIEKAGIGELIEGLASNDTIKEAVIKYAKKFAPTSTDARNAFMAMSQQVAMNVVQVGERSGLGVKQDEPNVFVNIAQMGAVVYALGVMGRLADRKGATQMAKRYADENPMMFASAMDEAKLHATATGQYKLDKLYELEDAVAKHFQLQGKIPATASHEQRVAATDILDQINHNKQVLHVADENFKDHYQSTIDGLRKKLLEVTTSEEAAIKHNNDVAKPAIEQLRKSFPKPIAPEFKGVVVRHGQTDANITGKQNLSDEPLNDMGKQQAKELGVTLKEQGVTYLEVSPMKRSRQTADETGIPYTVNADLAEWNTGHEGKFDADFDAKYYVEHPNEKPDNGESFGDFLGRVQKVKFDISDTEAAATTAVITHGKVMKLWEVLDKSGGKWDEKAQIEFLKDSNDFDNTEIYTAKGTKKGNIAKTSKSLADEPIKQTGPTLVQKGASAEAVKGAPSKMPLATYKEHMLDMLDNMKESEFDWRVTDVNLSQKDRAKGVADIRAGKDSKAAQKIEKLIQDTYDAGTITMNRGRGNQAETIEFTHDEWFGDYGKPVTPEEVNKIDATDDNAIDIIKRDGITLDNIDNLKNLFDGFPYTAEDLADVKDYLKRQGESTARNKGTGEKSEGSKATRHSKIDDLASNAPESEQGYFKQRKDLVDKYGKDIDEMIEDLKKEGRLRVDCPPGMKRRFSLRNLLKTKS